MSFDPASLQRIVEWRATAGVPGPGLVDYVGECLGPSTAVAVAGMLWPRLIQVEDCIFIEDRYDPASYGAWKERGTSLEDIELAINHVHLWDVFSSAESLQDEALEFLGNVMARTWHLAADESFPDRQFVSEYSSDASDYGPTVSLCTRR